MTQTRNDSRLRIVPLGGVGEVGKNCTLLEFDGEFVLVDIGVKFPEAEMPGIDLIIPDLKYVIVPPLYIF